MDESITNGQADPRNDDLCASAHTIALLDYMKRSPRDLAGATGVEAYELKRRSLVSVDEPWDAVQLGSCVVLPEAGQRVPGDRLVLRPFWQLEGDLTYHMSSHTKLPAGMADTEDMWMDIDIRRRLLKCCTPEYVWKDCARSFMRKGDAWVQCGVNVTQVFRFNHYEQSLRLDWAGSAAPSGADVSLAAARTRAMWTLPVVPPVGVVHLGQEWDVMANNNNMRYCVESFQKREGAVVVFIRRRGQLRPILPGGESSDGPVFDISGLAVWDVGQAVVLEDRSFIRQGGQGPEATTRAVVRLVDYHL